jgi:hypothetical protein
MTLNEILLDSSSYLDLDAVIPIGTELTTRIRFANMAVNEWAQATKWRQLKTESSFLLASFASLSLAGYQYLNGPVMENLADGIYREYPEIKPEDRFYKEESDNYCYVTGNNTEGFYLNVNGLNSNSVVTVSYIRAPSAMATLTDVCEVPDPSFVTDRVISYILQARNDERFPIVMAEGNRILRNMISQEAIQLPGGVNTTPKKGVAAYRIGG